MITSEESIYLHQQVLANASASAGSLRYSFIRGENGHLLFISASPAHCIRRLSKQRRGNYCARLVSSPRQFQASISRRGPPWTTAIRQRYCLPLHENWQKRHKAVRKQQFFFREAVWFRNKLTLFWFVSVLYKYKKENFVSFIRLFYNSKPARKWLEVANICVTLTAKHCV